MKKLFYIFMLLISARSFNAQITLAGQLNNTLQTSGLELVHLSSGYNFVQRLDSSVAFNTNYGTIRLYDLNINPVKTIQLPTYNWPGYNQVSHGFSSLISDHLFNSDNSIEFLISYRASKTFSCSAFANQKDTSVVYVMNENGTILATLANQSYCGNYSSWDFRYYSDGSTFSKLAVSGLTNTFFTIYNLPGFLPCETCSMPTGFSSQGANSTDGMKVNVLPNPSSGDFTFQYTLPKDKQNGELTITDIGGSQVKTVNITNQSASVSVNMSDLSSGVYIFQLKSGTSQSSPQKIILAK